MSIATAQETYKEFVKLGLRPPLRQLGFRGSGTTFVWPCSTAFAQIGLQKDRWSTRETLSFTANISVITHDEWANARARWDGLPDRPSPNTTYPGVPRVVRIGELLGRRADLWWELTADEEWHHLATEVVDTFRSTIVPELARRTYCE